MEPAQIPTSDTLYDRLQGVGYRLTRQLTDQVTAALHTRPCAGSFLTGPAGTGKTFLAEAVAQVEGCETFFFQAFPGCRKEELYQTILPDANQPSGFRTLDGVLPQAAEATARGRTALILDEWDKTHPSTDAFLLDFLQSGRISVPGCQVRAEQQNLMVFVTLNDERQLSEPLLRRLPVIELNPAPADVIAEALRDSHADHRYLGAAVTLYRRSQLVDLSKPVTIQELRQLLDAITHLGPAADWNRLVYQFCTKNWDDHELLKSAESLPLGEPLHFEGERAALDPGSYEGPPPAASGEDGGDPAMPRVQRDWMARLPSREVALDANAHFGVVPRSEPGYDAVARAALYRHDGHLPGSDAAHLDFAQVGDSEIVVFEALDLERITEWGPILRNGGELLLAARHGGEIDKPMLQAFRAGTHQHAPEDPNRCLIYSITDDEMLMRYRSAKIRWTPEVLEVVSDDYQSVKDFWDFLYSDQGAIADRRRAMEQAARPPEPVAPPSGEQMRQDYLHLLREYRHLAGWFDLLLQRNLGVWGQITCAFDKQRVIGSELGAPEFDPDGETPSNKAEADAMSAFRARDRPAADYLEAHRRQIQSELTTFVARNGEFPPAVEDGRIFSWERTGLRRERIKQEGLKLYMQKGTREV